MFQATVPPLARTLRNLSAILAKGAAHAEANKLDPSTLTGFRLYPDMYPLMRQVQIATDIAKGGVARLAGETPERFEDNETTFAELIARIDRTLALIERYTPAQIDGSEQREITLKTGGVERHFDGQRYLLHFVLPNVFFHATTAYAILRHNGVALGKMDFLGSF